MRTITINTEDYERAHGGRKPRGMGVWSFRSGNNPERGVWKTEFYGMYSESAKAAKAAARYFGIDTLTVRRYVRKQR